MAFFTPFAYREQKVVTPVPTWDPSDFTDIQYWWRADSGVTTGTGGVSSWVDQINSFDLQQSNSSNRPSSTTNSNLNNQDVISFNGTSDYLWTTTTPASLSNSDFTVLVVYYLPSSSPGPGAIISVPWLETNQNPYEGRFLFDCNGGVQRLFDEGFSSPNAASVTVQSPIVSDSHSMKIRFDASAGDMFYAFNTLTETTKGTSGIVNQDWRTGAPVALGATVTSTNGNIFLSRYIDLDMAEIVFVYGTPSTDEMNDWKTYVNNRYGTIIS